MSSKPKKSIYCFLLLGLSLFLLITFAYSSVGLKECKNCPAPAGHTGCTGGGSCDGFKYFTCTNCTMHCYGDGEDYYFWCNIV